MIQEITNFVDELEKNNPDIFSKNLILKEGLYISLEKKNKELVISHSLEVNENTEKNWLYNEFLKRYTLSKMISGKSMNSIEKIFIDIGSPYGISISGKGLKPQTKKGVEQSIEERKKEQVKAYESYFKAIDKYLDRNNKEQIKYFEDFKNFVRNKMLNYLYNNWNYSKIKNGFTFYFFSFEPKIRDYKDFHDKYLASKVFLYDLKKDENYGVSNELFVGNINKPFLRHKTAPFNFNYKVEGITAKKIYNFFQLQSWNKILPNPLPLFVDKKELNGEVISLYNNEGKRNYSEIVKDLIENHKVNLENYYLIFFHNRYKKSRIVDLDFVPVFKYYFDKKIKIKPLFNIYTKNKGYLLNSHTIENIFDLEKLLNNNLFLQFPNNSTKGYGILKTNFFSSKIQPSKGYEITDTIINLLYKYRKAIYDYIYKSRRQSINSPMFDDMMIHSILDDIMHDEDYKNEYSIKQKLNIWFSLYNFFNHNNKNREDMASKIPELTEQCKKTANEGASLSDKPEEFAFAAGQILYFLFTKSKSSNKSHALLEPFLQKSKASLLQDAITNTINTYKHEIDFGKSRFENLAREVLAYETNVNMKSLQRYLLAGYFADSVIYEKSKNTQNDQETI